MKVLPQISSIKLRKVHTEYQPYLSANLGPHVKGDFSKGYRNPEESRSNLAFFRDS